MRAMLTILKRMRTPDIEEESKQCLVCCDVVKSRTGVNVRMRDINVGLSESTLTPIIARKKIKFLIN